MEREYSSGTRRRAVLAAAAGLFGGITSTLAQGIYLQSFSAASTRYAVLEDDGYVAYLYICGPNTLTPERSVVVYSRRPPVAKVDWWELQQTGDTAPISRDIASGEAVIAQPAAQEFTFKWSRAGDAVALLRRGKPLAYVAAEQPGRSKAVAKQSPLAVPWDQRAYESLFGRH